MDLPNWLSNVIKLNIHDRAGWGKILDINPGSIGNWTGGKHIPRSDTLRKVLNELRLHSDQDEVKAVLADWEEIANLALAAAWPGKTNSPAPTLGHYAAISAWEDIRASLSAMLPSKQLTTLEKIIELAGDIAAHDVQSRPVVPVEAPVEPPTAPLVEEVAPSLAQVQ